MQSMRFAATLLLHTSMIPFPELKFSVGWLTCVVPPTATFIAGPCGPAGPGAPASNVQAFRAVQLYRFAPAEALVLKKASPIEQVAGSVVPDLNGFVVFAPVKSTLLVCVRKSTSVCPYPRLNTSSNRICH